MIRELVRGIRYTWHDLRYWYLMSYSNAKVVQALSAQLRKQDVTMQTAQMAIDGTLSEREFQSMVLQAAHYFGWVCYHTHDSRRSQPGYPDLTCIHPAKHRFLIREIKTQRGRLRPEQVMWLEALQASGVDAGVWRPSDWETIMETLSA